MGDSTWTRVDGIDGDRAAAHPVDTPGLRLSVSFASNGVSWKVGTTRM